MRLVITASIAVVAIAALAASQLESNTSPATLQSRPGQELSDGGSIFRFDTFGDEQLWTDVLRMHEAIASVDPATALAVGLKVDVEALPGPIIDALRTGQVNLKDPAVTVELLRHDAVVGVRARIDNGEVASVGITCALCHSTVDDSFAPGIGRRLDGWANSALNVGAIVALLARSRFRDEVGADRHWGPGKYDPRRQAFDGTSILPLNSPSVPVVIPPIYGLKGVGFETVTADGPISYWNTYVGVSQMGGRGTFVDPRIGLRIIQSPDLVTPKLPALLEYQLSLRAPSPPANSFDRHAARRGRQVFREEGRCAACHEPPRFTDVLSGPRAACLRSCTILPQSERSPPTRRAARPEGTEPRRCGRSGSTRPTSTTAAQRTFAP